MTSPHPPDTKAKPKEIQLADAFPPGLDGGDYELTLTQRVTPAGKPVETYSQAYAFTVAGPRFSLDPSVVHSIFPPQGARGAYSSYLPQAVFRRATLPWERTIDGRPPVRGQTAPPFLAILLLDGKPPKPVTGTVSDVLPPAQGGTLPTGTAGPQLPQLDRGEALTDACVWVDVPLADFLALAPTQADLTFLAHARKVDRSAKPTPVASPDGWFSVVVGNRFPALGVESTAYLVSLEGFAYLLSRNGEQVTPPAGVTAVRLVVFASWGFEDGFPSDFLQLMKNLSTGPLALPRQPAATEPEQDAEKALAMGYTALDHTTRQAESAVSWYRGPFVPLPLEQEAVTTYSCSDAALRFDPERGMLDVSYSAAWQLGRLLALGDGQFVRALYEWRRDHQRNAVRLVGKVLLARRFPSLELAPEQRALLLPHDLCARVGAFLARRVGPALLGTDLRTPPPELGPLADRSGLRRLAHRLPGLVSVETLARHRGEAAAVVEEVRRAVRRLRGPGRGGAP